MIKLILIISVICSLGLISRKKNLLDDPQITFARDQFERLIKKDFSNLDSLYLSKKEITDHLNQLVPKPPKSEIGKQLENYDKDKERFMKDYKRSMSHLSLSMGHCDSISWDQVSVDSIIYGYGILDHTGRHKDVFWPEAKNYLMKDSEITLFQAIIYFNDGHASYGSTVNAYYYQKSWRFYKINRLPRFFKLNH